MLWAPILFYDLYPVSSPFLDVPIRSLTSFNACDEKMSLHLEFPHAILAYNPCETVFYSLPYLDVSLEIGHREQGDYHKLNYNRFEVSQS